MLPGTEQPPAPVSSPAATASPAPTTSAQPASSTAPVAKASPAKPAPKTKPPLTVQKLKNTEYFLLAEGPVTLKNGKYQDAKKRTFTLGDVVSYGDLNKDGIKDAVAPLIITISGRDFTYLVGVLNEGGNPKNTSAEFLGERVKVKTLAANAGKIDIKMDKFGPNDPDCCPSMTVTRTYLYKPFKQEAVKKDSKATDKKATDQKAVDSKATKEPSKQSPSPAASPKN